MNWWERDQVVSASTPGDWWAKDKLASAPRTPTVEDDKKKLAESTSGMEAFKIGAGKAGDAMWEGVKQGGMGVGAILAEGLPESFEPIARLKQSIKDKLTAHLVEQERRQAGNAKEYKPLEEAHPIATGFGEAAPVAGAPMLRAMQGAKLLPTMVNSALSSAVPAAMEYGTAQERGVRGGIAGAGGAVAGGLTSAASKVMGGVTNTLTPEARRIAALAEEKFNIPLDAAQKTGNKALQTIEAAMESMPVTSGAQAIRKTGQRDAFTREVMKTLGETVEEATPATLAAAKGRMGGEFERIFSKVHVKLDDDTLTSNLGKVMQEAIDTLPPDQSRIVAKRIGEIVGKVDDNGAVAGKAYQAWRSSIQQQAEKTSDQWLGKHLRDLYRTVDAAAYKSASEVGEDGALKTVRGQYRNMKTISPLVAKSEDGIIPPQLLRGEVMKHTPDYAQGGGGDLADLAKIGRAFIGDQVPNSGTAQRALAQSLLTGGGVGGLAYMTSGDPMTAAKWAAGSVMLPKLAQKALHSGAAQRVMAGGRPLTPIELALIDRATRVGALGAVGAASE